MHSVRTMKSYHTELKESLDDSFLRETLDKFAVAYRASRVAVFADIDEKEAIRHIAEFKAACIERLDELYTRFAAEAAKRGVIVHRAATGEEANALICRIAAENDCYRIIKAKSMTGEEIFLNRALEEAGYEVVETDLGEWIVQLRKEGPTHMVIPAIHLSRNQVADLFSNTTGKKQESDPQKLVKVARRMLRGVFAHADMGISGANFAVAESGTIGLCTNEGNARLVTTLPRVHVALCGLDKLVPTVEEALRIIKVLPRNATGQRISSYVTWITGATECRQNPDDRKIIHIIFLDNGRSALAEDSVCKEALRCVRCGACANVCPVYRLVGGHKMGHVYIGAIGLIFTYFFHGKEHARTLAQNCINCGACKDVCGAGINLPAIIQELRFRLTEDDGAPLESSLLAAVMSNRKLFHSLLKFGKWAQLPVTGGSKYVRHLPSIFMGEQGFRSLPAIAKTSFREEWKEIKRTVPSAGSPRIGIFAGCAQDFVYPEQIRAAVKVLLSKGCAVDFPEDQSCCGLPLAMMGQRKTAMDVAIQNINAFLPGKYDYILTLCASCASHMKHAYSKLLGDRKEMAQQIHLFEERIIDFSSFVRERVVLEENDVPASTERVCYHAPCHLHRTLGVTTQPRELLALGADYIETQEECSCCGFGGMYSMKFPEISEQLLEKKLFRYVEAGASALITDCPGCVMQFRGGVEKRNETMVVEHMAEFLVRKMGLKEN